MSITPASDLEQVEPCPKCGCREVVLAVAPTGERERASFLVCLKCGGERADIEFYEDPVV
jgi:predicted nucleic-acid-binding Zn-ribbon protein